MKTGVCVVALCATSLVSASLHSPLDHSRSEQLHRRMSRRIRSGTLIDSLSLVLDKRQAVDQTDNQTWGGIGNLLATTLHDVKQEQRADRKKKQAAQLAVKHKKEEAAKKKQEAEARAKAKAEAEAAAKKKAEEEAAVKAERDRKKAEREAKKAAAASREGGGLIGAHDDNCGDSGANDDTPNGSQSFLNCGISKSNRDSGWNPPHVTLDQLKFASLDQAIKDGGLFSNCAPVADTIDQVGKALGLPPILIASIAMQESSCNPSLTGGAGEQGLMQLIPANCGGAPDGDCKNLWFNVYAGANLLKNNIDSVGGNFLLGLGMYNGWFKGMSYNFATQYAGTDQCRRQNNLDYLFSLTNGWLLNRGQPWEMGEYHNLDSCF
ncbi:hypothetical protein OIV83_001791 [Microbotryomycetes sp. JL201]|nr:hypothetical protein OIV83_001791 [Microbotryomycetes sp. JL201]